MTKWPTFLEARDLFSYFKAVFCWQQRAAKTCQDRAAPQPAQSLQEKRCGRVAVGFQ